MPIRHVRMSILIGAPRILNPQLIRNSDGRPVVAKRQKHDTSTAERVPRPGLRAHRDSCASSEPILVQPKAQASTDGSAGRLRGRAAPLISISFARVWQDGDDNTVAASRWACDGTGGTGVCELYFEFQDEFTVSYLEICKWSGRVGAEQERWSLATLAALVSK